jgi:hypothetical protein
LLIGLDIDVRQESHSQMVGRRALGRRIFTNAQNAIQGSLRVAQIPRNTLLASFVVGDFPR